MEYIVEEIFKTSETEEREKKLLEIIAVRFKQNSSKSKTFAGAEIISVSADKENGNG